ATPASNDIEAQMDQAKDRLEKARVRLEIAQKQVEAAKARLKAAESEFKAAKANNEAKNLENTAKKLSDASGLPEITEGQIQEGRKKSTAKKLNPFKSDEKAIPADLSKTRLKSVDFNAQPFDQGATPVTPATTPAVQSEPPVVPAPEKQPEPS